MKEQLVEKAVIKEVIVEVITYATEYKLEITYNDGVKRSSQHTTKAGAENMENLIRNKEI